MNATDVKASQGQYHRSSSARRRRSSLGLNTGSFGKYARVHEDHVRAVDIRRDRPSNLCGTCRSLDLSAGFRSLAKGIPFHGQFLQLVDIDEMAQSSGCALCQFLVQMRIPDLNDEGASPEGSGEKKYHLRVFAGAVSCHEYFLRPFTRNISSHNPTLIAVMPDSLVASINLNHAYMNTIGKVGYISPIAYTSDAPWLTARPIDAKEVDFPLLRGWLHYCKKNHDCSMRFSRPEKLQVIDCRTLQIVSAPRNCNYLALSYVWGPNTGPVEQQAEIQNGALVLSMIAPVVRDAITVVKRLEKRYLWVDKYCISQRNLEDKQYQIRMMDLIYEGAFATIVAAAGSDDRFGLAGIGPPRFRQPLVRLGEEEFASTLPDPQGEIRRSKWMTRAWTYQEALCSARLIIFTERQVYFECKVMHCCEAVEIPMNVLHTHDRKSLNNWIRPTMFKDEWVQGTHKYGAEPAFWSCVKNFTSRQMTYDSDSLNAMDGILRRFQAKPSFTYNILGIPIQAAADKMNRLVETAAFVAGLSWHHSEPPRRRDCLPSWTWAGWEASIALHKSFGSWAYHTTMTLSVLQKDGKVITWEEFWKDYWSTGGKETCISRLGAIYCDAEMFKVQLRLTSHPNTAVQGNSMHHVDIINPYDGRHYQHAQVILPLQFAQDERLMKKVKSDLWDCILLGWKKKCSGPDIMLIHWTPLGAERVWAGTLMFKDYPRNAHRSLLPPCLRRRFKLL